MLLLLLSIIIIGILNVGIFNIGIFNIGIFNIGIIDIDIISSAVSVIRPAEQKLPMIKEICFCMFSLQHLYENED